MKLLLYIISLGLICYLSDSMIVRSPLCDNNNVIFICTDNIGIANWEIRVPGSVSSITFSFGRYFPTNQLKYGPGLVLFTGMEEFVNTSYSITRVFFMHSVDLNLTEIECNTETITYIYPDTSFVPTRLRLIPDYFNDSLRNYFVTWTMTRNVPNYTINIFPSPIFGPIKGNSTYFTVSLQKNIHYDITLSWILCPLTLNATFSFGNCPLLRNINLLSVYQYSIDINGTINADIYCDFENQSYSLECEANTTHVCKSGASTYSNNLVTSNESNSRKPTTNDKVSVSAVVCLSVWVLVASLLGSHILILLIGIFIGIFLGVKIYQYNHNRNHSKFKSSGAKNDCNENSSKGPLYEEIELDMDKEIYNIADNVAYGQSNAKSGQSITLY